MVEHMHGEELSALYSMDELKHILGSVGTNVSVSRSVTLHARQHLFRFERSHRLFLRLVRGPLWNCA